MREIQEPEVTEENSLGGDRGTRVKHPAFGQIGISRVTGSTNLYGSDFRHNTSIVIRIARSELRRELSRDWHFARESLIEVALSEAQWATFVSSVNVGDGVPCTIERLGGKLVPGIPHRDEAHSYKTEADQAMQASLKALEELKTELEANTAGLSKAKQAPLIAKVDRSIRELKSHMPFIAESFSEHMEKRVEKAKVEINSFATAMVQRAGLEAIAQKQTGGAPILEIDSNDGEDRRDS